MAFEKNRDAVSSTAVETVMLKSGQVLRPHLVIH